MESADNFLKTKMEERKRFQKQQRADLEVRVIKSFVRSAIRWKISKRDEGDRLIALRQLRDLGIDMEMLP